MVSFSIELFDIVAPAKQMEKEKEQMSFYSVDIFYAVKDLIISIWG